MSIDVIAKTWIEKILNHFHIYTKRQLVDALFDATLNYTNHIAKIQESNNMLATNISEYENTINTLNKRLEKVTNASLENDKYVKDVQKQLSEILHGDITFGFPNKVTLPGCTSITSALKNVGEENEEVITVRGRSIITEEASTEIDRCPDMLLRLYLERYNITNRIALELMRSGTVGFTLAYNDKQNVYELYYEITALRQDVNSLIQIKDDLV